jgi:hypothetical protein
MKMKIFLLNLSVLVCTSCFSQTTNPCIEKSKAILSCFVKGDFAGVTKDFNETMKTELTPDKLKEAWNSVNQQAGAYVKYTAISDSLNQRCSAIYITCVFQNAKLMLKTVFDKNNKVAGLWFSPYNGPVCNSGFLEKSKSILNSFEKEDFIGVSKDFNETMKKELPPAKLKEVWNMINQQSGTFIKASTVESVNYQQYKIVYTTCFFQNIKLVLKTIFDTDCKVAGLFFVPENSPRP